MIEFPGGLDAFCQRSEAKILAELHQRAYERFGFWRRCDCTGECPVDLQAIDGELTLIGEREIPVPKSSTAIRTPRSLIVCRRPAVAAALRINAVSVTSMINEAAAFQRLPNMFDDRLAVELTTGNVDGDVEGVSSPMPDGRLSTSLTEHPTPDFLDHPGPFEDRDELVELAAMPSDTASNARRASFESP